MQLPKWLNEMGYGHPCYDTTEKLSVLVSGGIDLMPVTKLPKPPENISRETYNELKYLYELQEEEREFMEALIIKADRNPMSLFFEKCAEYQIEAYQDEVEQIKNLWGAITSELKMKYNRARPYQLAPYYGIGLFPMQSISAWSGAYPSGHTVQAEAVARFYSDRYPELADEFKKVAKAISHTRLVGGFHYPSDVLAGEELVEQLWNDLYSL